LSALSFWQQAEDIVVRMPEDLRADDDHQEAARAGGGDRLVSLGMLVEFETLKTVEPIQHDDGLRRAALMVNLKTRDIEGYVRELSRRIKEQVSCGELHRQYAGSSRICSKPVPGCHRSCRPRSR